MSNITVKKSRVTEFTITDTYKEDLRFFTEPGCSNHIYLSSERRPDVDFSFSVKDIKGIIEHLQLLIASE